MKFKYKRIFTVIVLMLFATLFFLGFVNCGVKKTEKEKKEEIAKTDFSGFFTNSGNSDEFLKTELNLKSKFNFNRDFFSESEIDEFTVSPADSTKPAVFIAPDGKKYILENAKLTNKKTKERKKETLGNSGNAEKSENSEVKKKNKYSQSTDYKKKKINKNSGQQIITNKSSWSFPFWFWLILLIVIAALVYYLFKKFNWINHVTAFVSRLFQFRKK